MQEFIEQAWHRAIKEGACANRGVSLCRSTDSDTMPTYYSTRLLELKSNGALILERPDKPGASKVCQEGESVDLYIREDDQCWAGRCKVLARLSYDLNSKRRIHALELSPAKKTWSAQRRAFFRVDATGNELNPGQLAPIEKMVATLHLLEESEKSQETQSFEANLYDISGNGIGVRLRRTVASPRDLHIKQRFHCICQLLDDESPLEVEVILKRLEKIKPDLLHLGMAFDVDDPVVMRKIQDRMTRFASDLQRLYLSRRHSA